MMANDEGTMQKQFRIISPFLGQRHTLSLFFIHSPPINDELSPLLSCLLHSNAIKEIELYAGAASSGFVSLWD